MFRRTKTTALALLPVLAMAIFPTTAHLTSANTPVTVPAREVSSLSVVGRKFDDSTATGASITFTNTTISDGNVELDGSVTHPGSSAIPFSLTGKLFSVSGSNLVGDLTDTVGNFDVIDFAIDGSPQHDVLLTPPTPHMTGSDTVALYLLRKGTRDFFYTEQPGAIMLSGTEYASGTEAGASLPSAGSQITPWFERVFAPVGYQKTQSPEDVISPDTYHIMDWIDGYLDDYYVGGQHLGDWIQLYVQMDYPDTVSGDTAVSCQLQVYDHWIFNWNTNQTINHTSGWKVGYNGPAGCKLSTQRPGGIYGVTTGGQVTSQGNVTWSVSLSASISYGPLDLSTQLAYQAPQNVSAGSFVPGNNKTTQTSYLPSNDYLQDVGQYYANSFQLVRAQSGSGQNVPCAIVFIYNIYNYGASLQGGNPTPYGNPQKDVMSFNPYFS